MSTWTRPRKIAKRIGEDRDDFGTEFGPTNVALDLAQGINAGGLSAERQARYDIDLAQAHAMRRQIGEALRCLEEAERLTPSRRGRTGSCEQSPVT